MMFLERLVGTVALGTLVVIACAVTLLFIVWGVNRGIQFFAGLLGYEVGDFFGWLMAKLHIRKKSKKK